MDMLTRPDSSLQSLLVLLYSLLLLGEHRAATEVLEVLDFMFITSCLGILNFQTSSSLANLKLCYPFLFVHLFGADQMYSKANRFSKLSPATLNYIKKILYCLVFNRNINHSDESLYSKPSRKSSSSSSSSTTGFSNHLSASNPDISSLTLGVDDRSDYPEHVVKVYRADQSFKFLLIHKVS